MRHAIFTVEVCARLDLAPVVLERLRPVVRDAPAGMTRDEAWRRHAEAARIVQESFAIVERGCWEYFDDEERAKAIFDDWCRPLVQRAQGAGAPPAADQYRTGGPRYFLLTMVYLLARDSPSDLRLRRACDIPGASLWRRSTFWRLLGEVQSLSFASVRADAFYLVPRDAGWGLTGEDLATQTYAYLRPLTAG